LFVAGLTGEGPWLTDAWRAETDRRVQIEAVHLSLKALRELLKKT
jgi:hypothetical protein